MCVVIMSIRGRLTDRTVNKNIRVICCKHSIWKPCTSVARSHLNLCIFWYRVDQAERERIAHFDSWAGQCRENNSCEEVMR